jgi:hypothetical protein
MNLTVTPSMINNNKYNAPNVAFKANVSRTAEQMISDAATKDSGLFSPLNKKYEQFTDWLADKATSHIVNWKPLVGLADKLKNTDNLFQYCLTLGSVITSGLYMQRTLTNKELDKDRKQTLAVNQGLTLIVSTIGAYALDGYMKDWWENVTARFAGHLLDDKEFHDKFVKQKKEIKAANKKLLEEAKGGEKPELKQIPKITKLMEKHHNYLSKLPKEQDLMHCKVKGMGPLRSMIVFGFVYRFFVPVAVTKPANKLCEMYLEKKKAKAAATTEKQA